jgi:hypothetical protein
MPYQQFNTIFTSTQTFPLAYSQCSINELRMESPLHAICLDEGMEHSFIHANYADEYLPNIIWFECQCPLSGHQTHYTNVTLLLLLIQLIARTHVKLERDRKDSQYRVPYRLEDRNKMNWFNIGILDSYTGNRKDEGV